jgi:hypothetical protein
MLDLEMLPYADLSSAVLSPIPVVVLIDEKVMGQLQRITNIIVRVINCCLKHSIT